MPLFIGVFFPDEKVVLVHVVLDRQDIVRLLQDARPRVRVCLHIPTYATNSDHFKIENLSLNFLKLLACFKKYIIII